MYKNKWRVSWKKITFGILILFIFTVTLLWDFVPNYWLDDDKTNLLCFELQGNQLPELDENEPQSGSGIYFHETSCPKNLFDIFLNARQACSVESALKAHPSNDVFLLITTPVFKPLEKTNNIFVQQLLTYPNFKLRHINFSKYLSNTPLKVIQTSGVLNFSLWPVPHASDVLRYSTLYKFGGIYLDLDVIVLKPLTKLKNFAGAESNVSIGSGILGFSNDEVGREVATKCAQELRRTYNGKIWGSNGPGVITRVLSKRCKTLVISKMYEQPCEGFNVFPPKYFSALSFNEPDLFFKEGNTKKVRHVLNDSYTIHYWNKMSSGFILNKKYDVPFIYYARKFCPKIFKVIKGNF